MRVSGSKRGIKPYFNSIKNVWVGQLSVLLSRPPILFRSEALQRGAALSNKIVRQAEVF